MKKLVMEILKIITLNKLKDKALIKKENKELIMSKKEINACNRALDELKKGETISFKEYLNSRNIE